MADNVTEAYNEVDEELTTAYGESSDSEVKGVAKEYASGGSKDVQVNVHNVSVKHNIPEDMIIDDLNMTNLEKEQNPYTKSDLSGSVGKSFEMPKEGESLTIDYGSATDKIEITAEHVGNSFLFVDDWAEDDTVYHVKSAYLGEFDFNADEFELKYKEIKEVDGTVSKLPYLEYIGDSDGMLNDYLHWDNFAWTGSTGSLDKRSLTLPDGLKSMDYMFANNEKMVHVPAIPESVISMHCSFENCTNLREFLHRTSRWHAKSSGEVILPSNLEDLSSAFKNCENLEGNFADLPESVLNISNMCDGANKIGSDYKSWFRNYEYSVPGYGGIKTPYLTSDYAKDALNVSSEPAKKQADSAEFIIDEAGHINQDMIDEYNASIDVYNEEHPDAPKAHLNMDQLTESEMHTVMDFYNDIAKGKTYNNAEMASGGARSNNYYYDARDESVKDDVTGLMISDKRNGGADWWHRYAIDGVAALSIGGVIGSKFGKYAGLIAGVGGAAALDYFNVIPESLSPIVGWIAEKLPEGGAKDKLNELVDKWKESKISMQEEALTAENIAATFQNRRAQRSFYGIQGTYCLNGAVENSLFNNASYCGANLNFKASADAAVQYGEKDVMTGTQAFINEATTDMELFFKSKIADGTYKVNSPEFKQDLKDYYVSLMQGLESYNEGAQVGISKIKDAPDAYQKTSQEGLNMMNRAYTTEVMESLLEMNDEYGFMDDDAWKKISSMNISGVDIENIKNYDDTYFNALKAESIANVQSIMTEAGEKYVRGSIIAFDVKDDSSYYNTGEFYNEGNNTTLFETRAKQFAQAYNIDIEDAQKALNDSKIQDNPHKDGTIRLGLDEYYKLYGKDTEEDSNEVEFDVPSV